MGVILGLYIFSRKENIRFSDITDVYASFFPLGQAIEGLAVILMVVVMEKSTLVLAQ